MKPDKKLLDEFQVNYPKDSDFSAYARLLQSQWREKKGYPIGKSAKGQVWGNYIDADYAKKEKVIFLTCNIQELVTQEIEKSKTEKTGALISEPRIWNNLLSSQPLCFNLFGEFYFDLNLATEFFKDLFPGKIDKVMAVKFEYSPGRGNTKYLGDRSAFDVFVEYRKGNKRGFIGIEVKYSESLEEETKGQAIKNFEKPEQQYEHWTNTCGIFEDGSIDHLKVPPLSQIWRDHLLCIATKQDYDEGFFVFLFPQKNSQCQEGVNNYQKYLKFDDEKQKCFYPLHLENFVNVLTKFSKEKWVTELKERYLGIEE